mgnify:CR=1 FL=1|jgi:uncharacterized OB-fold protein
MVRLVNWFCNLFKKTEEVRHFEGLPSDNIWTCSECGSWNSPWRMDCAQCKTKVNER